uniref:FBD domain-containing protein n=1 Tax=Steinernema glaseri TaxID=37863 RepID=A0A1I7ZZT2_9BILA
MRIICSARILRFLRGKKDRFVTFDFLEDDDEKLRLSALLGSSDGRRTHSSALPTELWLDDLHLFGMTYERLRDPYMPYSNSFEHTNSIVFIMNCSPVDVAFNKLAVSEPQKPQTVVFATIYVPSEPDQPCLWQCNAPDVNQEGLNLSMLSIVLCPDFAPPNVVPLHEVAFSRPLRFKTLIVNRLSQFPVLPMIAKDFESIQLTSLYLHSEQLEAFFAECMNSQSLKKVRLSKTF